MLLIRIELRFCDRESHPINLRIVLFKSPWVPSPSKERSVGIVKLKNLLSLCQGYPASHSSAPSPLKTTRKPSDETDFACFIKATHERSKTGASVVRISSGNEFLMSSADTENILFSAPSRDAVSLA